MRSKGWERIQGRAGQAPTVPYYRGPEGDDEFTTLSSDERKGQIRQDAGRAMTPEEYQCARARRTMSQRPPPGVVCPSPEGTLMDREAVKALIVKYLGADLFAGSPRQRVEYSARQ